MTSTRSHALDSFEYTTAPSSIQARDLSQNYVRTFTGKSMHPFAPSLDEICIEDIAHGLANTCRFSGQVRHFYSVAQHSVAVASIVPARHRLSALLHDATEAYLGDLAKPIKLGLPDYQQVEAGLWRVITQKFGISETLDPAIKLADNAALICERNALLAADRQPWPEEKGVKPMKLGTIYSPVFAEAEFLREFRILIRK